MTDTAVKPKNDTSAVITVRALGREVAVLLKYDPENWSAHDRKVETLTRLPFLLGQLAVIEHRVSRRAASALNHFQRQDGARLVGELLDELERLPGSNEREAR